MGVVGLAGVGWARGHDSGRSAMEHSLVEPLPIDESACSLLPFVVEKSKDLHCPLVHGQLLARRRETSASSSNRIKKLT